MHSHVLGAIPGKQQLTLVYSIHQLSNTDSLAAAIDAVQCTRLPPASTEQLVTRMYISNHSTTHYNQEL